MLILTIRTDKPISEIGLFLDNKRLSYIKWSAHQHLAETIHEKINVFLKNEKKSLENIEGIICFKGPGSFTGLRIGLSVGNALAYALSIPTVGAEKNDWIESGIKKLLAKKNEQIVLPKYGSPPHITEPKR